MKKNKILVIVATHGNEPFALSMVRRLSKKYQFDWVIGNPLALNAKVRGTEGDLNRSGPGDPMSNVYEERRADKLIGLSKDYNVVLDIHSAKYLDGIVTIVTNPSWQNLELAESFPADKTVIWPSFRPDKSPLTQFMPKAIEIECGRSDNPNLSSKLRKLLVQYFENPGAKYKKDKYMVTGKIMGGVNKRIRDFELVCLNNRNFYPFLSNTYPGITTYMLQKVGEIVKSD